MGYVQGKGRGEKEEETPFKKRFFSFGGIPRRKFGVDWVWFVRSKAITDRRGDGPEGGDAGED